MKKIYSSGSHEVYWQQIHWPTKIEPDDALQLLRHIAADRRDQVVVFEVHSGSDGLVTFLVVCARYYMPYIKQLIESHVEGAFVTTPTIHRRPVTTAYTLKLTNKTRPLRVAHSKLTAKSILAALAGVSPPEHATLQLVLGGRIRPIAVPTRTQESILMPWWQRIVSPDAGIRVDREKRTAYRVKVATPGFRCALRIGVSAADNARQTDLCLDLVAGARTAETRGAYMRVRPLWRNKRFSTPSRLPYLGSMQLNINELLGLAAWPLGGDAMPGVNRRGFRLLYADHTIESSSQIIARSTAPGDTRLLGLNIQDALYHLHVLGLTGVGKSTFLHFAYHGRKPQRNGRVSCYGCKTS